MILLTLLPRSRPTQSPLLVGASKNVARSPSIAFSLVLPPLFQEPLVPIMVPLNLVSPRHAGARRRPEDQVDERTGIVGVFRRLRRKECQAVTHSAMLRWFTMS